MEVSGQLHASIYFICREINPATHCIWGWVGPRAGVDMVAMRKISPPYPSGHFNLAGKFKKSIQITYIYF
jgi:hypothetical protein